MGDVTDRQDQWRISETKIIIYRSGINSGIKAMTSIRDKPLKGILMENSSEDKVCKIYMCACVWASTSFGKSFKYRNIIFNICIGTDIRPKLNFNVMTPTRIQREFLKKYSKTRFLPFLFCSYSHTVHACTVVMS